MFVHKHRFKDRIGHRMSRKCRPSARLLYNNTACFCLLLYKPFLRNRPAVLDTRSAMGDNSSSGVFLNRQHTVWTHLDHWMINTVGINLCLLPQQTQWEILTLAEKYLVTAHALD